MEFTAICGRGRAVHRWRVIDKPRRARGLENHRRFMLQFSHALQEFRFAGLIARQALALVAHGKAHILEPLACLLLDCGNGGEVPHRALAFLAPPAFMAFATPAWADFFAALRTFFGLFLAIVLLLWFSGDGAKLTVLGFLGKTTAGPPPPETKSRAPGFAPGAAKAPYLL
jgi:hypothetical protein